MDRSKGQGRFFWAFLAVFVVIAVAAVALERTASSHVQPSVTTNNRYIKMTVFADRVRLAYIVYIGEIPGQAARGRLDRDRDGLLSSSETTVFRDEWAARVHAALRVESGAVALPVVWSSADVGLGDPRTSAGAFSLDLIAWLCPPAGARSLRLTDTLVIPEAGESEVLAEESPGTEITRAELGSKIGTRHSWNGPSHPIKDGFVLEWRADDSAPPAPGRCAEPTSSSGGSWWWWLGLLAATLLLAAGALLVWRRRAPGDQSV